MPDLTPEQEQFLAAQEKERAERRRGIRNTKILIGFVGVVVLWAIISAVSDRKNYPPPQMHAAPGYADRWCTGAQAPAVAFNPNRIEEAFTLKTGCFQRVAVPWNWRLQADDDDSDKNGWIAIQCPEDNRPQGIFGLREDGWTVHGCREGAWLMQGYGRVHFFKR